MAKTIYAQTSTRLLKEIPRFFGGFQPALDELFQNAYRAGANSVIVKYEKDKNLLVISDDGPGLSDAQRLITAGETGWNENDIVEPAGMGAFAILRPEFVESVEYQSRGAGNWTMTLTPEVLAGKPIEVTECQNPDGRTGLTVILHLAGNQDVSIEKIQKARALYPYIVSFMDDNGLQIVEPDTGNPPHIELQTPVGVIRWQKSAPYKEVKEVVWEYRRLSSAAFNKTLYRCQEKCKHPAVANALFSNWTEFTWEIDTASGVRAKLPDRNDLIDDQALEKAVQEMLDTFVDHVVQEFKTASANWPEKIPFQYDYSKRGPIPETGVTWIDEIVFNRTDYSLLGACLLATGWSKIEFDGMTAVREEDNGDDGLEVKGEYISDYYRNPPFTVGSRHLAFTLNNLDHPTLRVKDHKDPKVTIKGLKKSPIETVTHSWGGTSEVFASPWILLADEITIEGVGKVPYLLMDPESGDDLETNDPDFDQEFEDMNLLSIVFAGTPAQCIAAINNDDILAHLVAVKKYMDGWNEEWETDYYGERSVDWSTLKHDLEVQVMKAFAPALAEKRAYMYTLGNYEENLKEQMYQIQNIKDGILGTVKTDQVLSGLETTFSTLCDAADLIEENLKDRIKTLRAETELS